MAETRLLHTPTNPGGVPLEQLLDQITSELRHAQAAGPPTRERAIVITKLEEAQHWHIDGLRNQGRAQILIADPTAETIDLSALKT